MWVSKEFEEHIRKMWREYRRRTGESISFTEFTKIYGKGRK